MPTTFLGVDIAKSSFSLHILDSHKPKKSRAFSNNLLGFERVLELLGDQDSVVLGVEATSIYHMALATWAHAQGWTVFVINPLHVKRHAQSLPQTHKTDDIDAWHIAEFVRQRFHMLRPWSPGKPSWRRIRSLVRTRDRLIRSRVVAQNQLESTLSSEDEVRVIYERVVDFFAQEIEKVERRIRELIDNEVELREQVARLQQIPGIGEQTAFVLTAELGELAAYGHAKELTARAGLVPVERTSGSSVRGKSRVKRGGNQRVRSALYLGAMSARQSKAWKPWVKQREERGKVGMDLIMAIMDKMLRLAFGLMRKDHNFDPELAFLT